MTHFTVAAAAAAAVDDDDDADVITNSGLLAGEYSDRQLCHGRNERPFASVVNELDTETDDARSVSRLVVQQRSLACSDAAAPRVKSSANLRRPGEVKAFCYRVADKR